MAAALAAAAVVLDVAAAAAIVAVVGIVVLAAVVSSVAAMVVRCCGGKGHDVCVGCMRAAHTSAHRPVVGRQAVHACAHHTLARTHSVRAGISGGSAPHTLMWVARASTLMLAPHGVGGLAETPSNLASLRTD